MDGSLTPHTPHYIYFIFTSQKLSQNKSLAELAEEQDYIIM